MSEDCQKCGTAMWDLDEDGNCPGCSDDTWYCWEEQDWSENKLFYEYDLEHLEELNKRERHPTKERYV